MEIEIMSSQASGGLSMSPKQSLTHYLCQLNMRLVAKGTPKTWAAGHSLSLQHQP